MTIYKPQARIEIEIPKATANRTTETVTITPALVGWELHRNPWIAPDELKVTLDAVDGGIDPRFMRNARCSFWAWDAHHESFDRRRHLRFVGVALKPERSLGSDVCKTELSFADNSELFHECKPFSNETAGIEWSDTLEDAFRKLKLATGPYDPDEGRIVSSVDTIYLDFSDPSIRPTTIGEGVPERLRAISRPSFGGTGPSAWQFWGSLCTALGLITTMTADGNVVVRRVLDHFSHDTAPLTCWGHNVTSVEEHADPAKNCKGIILRGFDPLRGIELEAAYPPKGDPRATKTARVRAATPSSAKGPPPGRATAPKKDSFSDYMTEIAPAGVHTPEAMDRFARATYEQRIRQELRGKVTTAEMRLGGVDVLGLEAGDSIRVQIGDPRTSVNAPSGRSQEERALHLMRTQGLSRESADVLALNSSELQVFEPVHHIESVRTTCRDGHYETEIAYQNLIRIEGGTG